MKEELARSWKRSENWRDVGRRVKKALERSRKRSTWLARRWKKRSEGVGGMLEVVAKLLIFGDARMNELVSSISLLRGMTCEESTY